MRRIDDCIGCTVGADIGDGRPTADSVQKLDQHCSTMKLMGPVRLSTSPSGRRSHWTDS